MLNSEKRKTSQRKAKTASFDVRDYTHHSTRKAKTSTAQRIANLEQDLKEHPLLTEAISQTH